jgi:hypothetical protein
VVEVVAAFVKRMGGNRVAKFLIRVCFPTTFNVGTSSLKFQRGRGVKGG